MTALRTTERLALCAPSVGHAAALRALDADPRVMRWIDGGRPFDPDVFERDLPSRLETWTRDLPLGVYALHPRGDGGEPEPDTLLGLAMLKRDPRFVEDVEVGWRLGPAHWGHGYATEAARALVALAFEELGLERLISHSLAANARSQAVMARLGFRSVITFTYDAELLPGLSVDERRGHLRILTRADWERGRGEVSEVPR